MMIRDVECHVCLNRFPRGQAKWVRFDSRVPGDHYRIDGIQTNGAFEHPGFGGEPYCPTCLAEMFEKMRADD
jgi:hypothetical protein